MSSHTCSACHHRVDPIRTSLLWWVVAFVAAPVVLLSFMFLAVMQPVAIVAAPLYFWVLLFPIVGLAEKLSAKPRCPKCRKIFVEARPSRQERSANVGSSEVRTA